MNIRAATLLLALAIPCASQAQQPSQQPAQAPPVAEPTAGIDDVVVVNGYRYPVQLRAQMLDAELKVYDLFNQLNDNPAFKLECGRRNIAGTRLQTQDCVPVFERQALALEAQDQAEAHRAALNATAATEGGFAPGAQNLQGRNTDQFINYMPIMGAAPAGGLIKAGQTRLQAKMRQVAAEHPEFVEAIVSYVESKTRYAEATRRVQE